MYRVLIYHNDEVVEDEKFKTIEEAVRYADAMIKRKSGGMVFDESYWFKIKAD